MTESQLRAALVRSLFHFARRKAYPMGIFSPAKGGAYLKAGFLGFPGGGTTHTAFKIAIVTRALFKLEGPIVMFDSESGSDYVRDRAKAETGKDLLVVKSRSMTDLMLAAHEAVEI